MEGSSLDAAVVVLICFGWFIAASVMAVGFSVRHGEFSNSSFAALTVAEWALGFVALLYLRARACTIAKLFPVPTLRGTAEGGVMCLVGVACGGTGRFAVSAGLRRKPAGGRDGFRHHRVDVLAGFHQCLQWLL